MADQAAIPAATLVLLREGVGAPEILVIERAGSLSFAAGALAFPGGRIDAGDRALAATLEGDPDETAARLCAIRETVEEVGLAVGLLPPPDAPTLAALRARLHAGEPLGPALAAAGLAAEPGALTPFARWRPPAQRERRSYDTRFYLAHGTGTPAADGAETASAAWTTAAAVLAAVAAGRAGVIFPTQRNLERLAGHASVAAAFADAAAHPVTTVTPWVEERDGVPHLCIPAGLGYPVTAAPLTQVRRG